MMRDEHVAWAKQRALEYCDRGECANALASMGSDLNKHEETANHPAVEIGAMMMVMGELSNSRDMRRFIEGFR